MTFRRLAAALFACGLVWPTAARAVDINSAEVQASLRQAEQLGRLLHGKSRAAEIANALLAKEGIWHPGMPAAERPFQGRISLLDGEDWTVRYLGREESRVVSYFDVKMRRLYDATATLTRHARPVPVGDAATAMLEARRRAPEFVTEPCAGSYTVVVLPSRVSELAGWTVYALTGEADGEIAVGGHYRAEVSPDGKTLKSSERLSRACLALNKAQPKARGGKIGAFAAQELISDTPTEIHVYLSIRHEVDAYVETRLGKWLVSIGRIRFLDR